MAKELVSIDDWMADLEDEVEVEQAREVSEARYISFRNGRFAMGEDKLGRELEVVIVDFNFENAWYPEKWDKENPKPPKCFAIASEEHELAPHPTSPDPQAKTCADCELNAWGSDPEGGRGKACKNGRRLVLIDPEDSSPTPVLLRVPPTSIKFWKKYNKMVLREQGVPVKGVVTEIYAEVDDGENNVLGFNVIDKISDMNTAQKVIDSIAEAKKLLEVPIDVSKRKDFHSSTDSRVKRVDDDDDDDEKLKSSSRSRSRNRSDDGEKLKSSSRSRGRNRSDDDGEADAPVEKKQVRRRR